MLWKKQSVVILTANQKIAEQSESLLEGSTENAAAVKYADLKISDMTIPIFLFFADAILFRQDRFL